MEKISLQELVAINNTDAARSLVMKYGYTPAKNTDDLIYKLNRLIKEYREKGLKDLVEIHPHKDLLGYYLEEDLKKDLEANTKPCVCPEKKSNIEGETMTPKQPNEGINNIHRVIQDNMPMVAMCGLFALAITVIALKK